MLRIESEQEEDGRWIAEVMIDNSVGMVAAKIGFGGKANANNVVGKRRDGQRALTAVKQKSFTVPGGRRHIAECRPCCGGVGGRGETCQSHGN